MGKRLMVAASAVALVLGLLATDPARSATGPMPATVPVGMPDNVPAAATAAEPLLPTPAGWPFADQFSRTEGSGRLVDGTLEWTDFLYDDHGAQGLAVKSPVTSSAGWKGTYTYASADAHNNGADLFRLAVGLTKDRTIWRVDWNTLADAAIPIAEWALDTDANTATPAGAGDWPAGAGVHSPGIDRAIVVSSTGAWLVDAASGARTPVESTVDLAAKSFVVSIPTSLLPVEGSWDVRVASGVATADGASFAPVDSSNGALTGQPAVYNVSFRDYVDESPSLNYWFENTQATDLTSNDVTAFVQRVDWDALARRVTTPEPQPAGYTNRWYVSSLAVGDGNGYIYDDNGQDYRPNFLGRVQPYAVQVPKSYDGTAAVPLTWVLHSYSNNQNEYGGRDPKLLAGLCDARRSICATLLDRGPDSWYFDEGEVEIWEVWNRLAHAYRLDPERTDISGYSMGGFGTYKIALAHPDLFARALTLNGAVICGVRPAPGADLPGTTDHCKTDGDTTAFIGNARDVPFSISRGALDELVPIGGTQAQVDAFDALGYRYRDTLYPAEDHLDQGVRDAWWDAPSALGNDVRTKNPGHVTYAWYPDLDNAAWGIGTTGAYWIRSLSARAGAAGRIASVDATSGRRPESVVVTKAQSAPTPPAGGTPAIVTEQTWAPGPPKVATSTLRLKLTGLRAVTVLLDDAGFAPNVTCHAQIETDGPVTITFVRRGAATRTFSVDRATDIDV